MANHAGVVAERAVACRLVSEADMTRCREAIGADAEDQAAIGWLLEHRLLTKWQAAQLKAGRTQNLVLGHYKLLSPLGAGGMGAVFRALDERLGREVAVKVLPPGSATPEAVSRFRREALAALQLRHDHVVASYELGQQGSIHFLVMELVDGPSLLAHLTKQKRLSVQETARIGYEVALALEHARQQGIVHRDIKPANILLSRQGQVKLADLGLAKFFGPQSLTGGTETRTGQFMGTIDYCSPEQAQDAKRADIRSDIYSLGCTLYHCLTGKPPFAEGTEVERIMAHIELLPTEIRSKNPQTPPALAELIEKRMLAKQPADRFQAPAEAAEALAPWARGEQGATVNLWAALSGFEELLDEAAHAGPPAVQRDRETRARNRRLSPTLPSRSVAGPLRSARDSVLAGPLGWAAVVLVVLGAITAVSLRWPQRKMGPAPVVADAVDNDDARSEPTGEPLAVGDENLVGASVDFGVTPASMDIKAGENVESDKVPASRDARFELDAARTAISVGDTQSARNHLQAALAVYEERFDAGGCEEAVTDGLADALLDVASWWTVVEPGQMTSQAGATLTLLPDQSVLAGGVNPSEDVFTLAGRAPLQEITALMLETLPHETLPNRGPGRHSSGNFHLTELTLELANEGKPIFRSLPLAVASADYSQAGMPVSDAIDGDANTAWAIHPQLGQAHYAVFRPADPEVVRPGSLLKVTLGFRSVRNWTQTQAGRVRLLISDRHEAISTEEARFAISTDGLSPAGALGAALTAYGDEGAALLWLAHAAEDANCGAIVHFLLSLIWHERGEDAKARQAYDHGMTELQRNVAGEVSQFVARQTAFKVGGLTREQAAAAVTHAQDAAQLALLDAAIDAAPTDLKARRARGEFFASRARWKEAAADWQKLLEQPTALEWIELASILAAANDLAKYQAHCRRMLKRFENTEDQFDADKTAKACLLMAGAFDDWHEVRELGRRAVKLDGNTGWKPVLELAAALGDYRAGDLLAARNRLQVVSKYNLTPDFAALYHAVGALVSHGMKVDEHARNELEQATALIHDSVHDFARQIPFSHNWLIAEVVRREAATLIEGSPAGAKSALRSNEPKTTQEIEMQADLPMSKLAAPRLIEPPDGKTFNNLQQKMTLRWSPVDGAAKYKVEIQYTIPGVKWGTMRNSTGTREVAATEYEFDFFGPQPHRWRVWAVSDTGAEGPKSEWRTFVYRR